MRLFVATLALTIGTATNFAMAPKPASLSSIQELLIERTFLPDAGPSAFAIGFPDGVSFCFDPVRGGLNAIWTGGFIEIESVRPGPQKLISPAQPLGPVVYRERGPSPLRLGNRERIREIQFQGYRLVGTGIEFRYALDGVNVRERYALEDGSLIRYFSVSAPGGLIWYIPGEHEGTRPVVVGGREVDGAYVFHIGVGGGEFIIKHATNGGQP